MAPDIAEFFESIGLSPEHALEATFLVGLTAAVALVYGFYRLGIAGAALVSDEFTAKRLEGAFAHSLVPIVFAYVAAHYLSFLVFQGQAMWFLASNPLGEQGVDIFGTADRPIDYSVIGASFTQYAQVFFVVRGPRRGAGPGPRPGARALQATEAGGAVAVLDARGDGGLHEPGPRAPAAIERMTLQVAHAGHWLVQLTYFLPVVAFLAWLAFTTVKERRRDRKDK